MICLGKDERHFYCLDQCRHDVLLVELVQNPTKKREYNPVILKRFENAASFIGSIEVSLDMPINLHNFSYPLEKEECTLPEGIHQFDLLNIDVLLNQHLKNIDIVTLPGSVLGLNFAGLVVAISRQNRKKAIEVAELSLMMVLTNRLNYLKVVQPMKIVHPPKQMSLSFS